MVGFGNRTGKREYHNLLAKTEITSQGKTTQEFTWDFNVVSMTAGESAGIYLLDELGSSVRLLGIYRNYQTVYGYDEFGQDVFGNQGEVQPFGYTGYQMDNIAKTYFAQAREYLPRVGRFGEADVVKGSHIVPQSLNSYGYCWGNPIIWVDLDGRKAKVPSTQDIQKWVLNEKKKSSEKGITDWWENKTQSLYEVGNQVKDVVFDIVDIEIESGYGGGIGAGVTGVKVELSAKMYKSWDITSSEFGKIDVPAQFEMGINTEISNKFKAGAGFKSGDIAYENEVPYTKFGYEELEKEDDWKVSLFSASLYLGGGAGIDVKLNLSKAGQYILDAFGISCDSVN